MTTAGLEPCTGYRMSRTARVTKPGYAYIYLSNESLFVQEVYFDDFSVKVVKATPVQNSEYYPFGLETSSSWTKENATNNKLLYNGKELQDELGLDWYDYGARMYMPEIGRWGAPDALAELGFSLTPYRYCYNSPINYTDPFGYWEQDANGTWSTTDASEITRFTTYLQIESGAFQIPEMSQVNGFINMEHEKPGSGTLSDGSSFINDQVNINGYGINNSYTSWYVDIRSFQNAWHGVQGSLTPDDLDPLTLHKNIFGLSYPGGNNPKTYSGKDDYSYVPANAAEYPAIGHDRRYSKLGTNGLVGLLTDTRTIGADWQFVSQETSIANSPSFNLKTRVQAFLLAKGLGALAYPKTLFHFVSPQPSTALGETMMWYSVGNDGVTNKPD